MARKLCNVGVVLALMLGCWGGVLAAVACPHESCKTTATASANTATHDEHTSGHVHDQAVTHEEHSRHAQPHEGQAAEPPARARSRVSTGGLRFVAAEPHDPLCTHCVGRNQAPPSSCFERRADSARKGGESAAPAAVAPITAHAAAYVREITPAQHAPPGRSDRHLLLGVFRI